MIFTRKGRVSQKYKFTFGPDSLNIVKSYLYLGVLFTPHNCFAENSKRAVNKAATASTVAKNLGVRTRVHNWKSNVTLYQAIVTTTLLYGAEVWAPRYTENMEKAQMRFFKNLLYLPRSTPNYIIRRKTGTEKMSTVVLERTLKWWRKILDMKDSRYPKICYKELKRMENYEPLKEQHNWAAQLRRMLIEVDKEELYNCESSDCIDLELKNILRIHKTKVQEEDTRRITNSSYSTLYRKITDGVDMEKYLTFDLRTEVIRTVSHIRVASVERIQIYTNKCCYVVNSKENCMLCNHGERETLGHILLRCPLYAEVRTWLRPYLNSKNSDQALVNLLKLESPEKVNRVYIYISTVLRLRSFCLCE